MSKVILALIIAVLSYVCIAQSNLIKNNEANSAEQSAQSQVSEAKDASQLNKGAESKGSTKQSEFEAQGSRQGAPSEGRSPEAKAKLEAKLDAKVEEKVNAKVDAKIEAKLGELTKETEEESFIDAEVAKTIKSRFIAIDQNREERSDMWKGRVDRLLNAMKVPESVKSFLYRSFLGTNIAFLISGFCAIALAYLLQTIIIRIKNAILRKTSKKKSLRAMGLYIDCFLKPFIKFIMLFGISICVYLNITNESLLGIGAKLLALYFFWLGLTLVLSLINTFFDLLLEKLHHESPAASMLIPLGRNIGIILSVIIFSLVVLENFGMNVSAILASLGIGGAALAFASKDTIANFFGSVSLIIDRPFVVGHEVRVASWHGFVEKIGLRSTRIRTLDKTLICLPNSILANEYIENLSLRRHRRVEFCIGLVYSTTQDQLQEAIKAIKNALIDTKGVVNDPIIVRFDEFADSSLNIFIRFFSDRSDFASYIEVKDRANFAIMKAVRDLSLSMAFPSRSLYLENESINISQKNIPTIKK